jgi:protein arginine kinase
MTDVLSLPDYGLAWLDAAGPEADIVLSTRVRLARNLQGRAFGLRARAGDRDAVLREVEAGIGRSALLTGASVRVLSDMEPRTRRLLLERRLVSRDLLGGSENGPPPRSAAVVLPDRDELTLMVNEEDHLRLQSLRSGLRLHEAWRLVDRLDDELGQELALAYHPEFGFLTSCPTNVGTGLRASVLMHLPGLVLTKEIGKVLKGLNQVGLTFRGLYGEGSEVLGNFFQVSNQTTLGQTEEDLVDHLYQSVSRVIGLERTARGILLKEASAVTEDKIWRAYGLLFFARSLTFEEMINLLSAVRLGVGLKLLPGLRVYSLNKILIYAQQAHLEQAAGRDLPPPECDAHRASLVRRVLASEGVVTSEGEGSRHHP